MSKRALVTREEWDAGPPVFRLRALTDWPGRGAAERFFVANHPRAPRGWAAGRKPALFCWHLAASWDDGLALELPPDPAPVTGGVPACLLPGGMSPAAVFDLAGKVPLAHPAVLPEEAVRWAGVAGRDPRRRGRALGILEDLAGDPFEPWLAFEQWAAWTGWEGGLVAGLAGEIYRRDAHDELPILADALDEAMGATGETGRPDLLAHLRGPGPHYRGCWALDALLGEAE